MSDLIDRQMAIDALDNIKIPRNASWYPYYQQALTAMSELPSAQPEIIRCHSCKYWAQSTGKMKGCGLGRCDFHDADLVTCSGFCYWAERREE